MDSATNSIAASSTALVTGASSGIGKAIALRLAKDGFKILVHYNKGQDRAAQVLQEIQSLGGRGELLSFDVADKTAVETALNTYFENHKDEHLDILINNAGIHSDTLLGIMSDEGFDSVMKTNVYGAFYLMRWTVRRMLRRRQGCIVNMSSLAGQTGNPGQVNYAASKAALIAMTQSLAMEVGSRGIRVNAVAPGFIETEMIQNIPQLEEYKKRIPLGRFGSPQEVAGVVSFLCSKDAGYMTGTTLSVNGGLYPA